MFATVGLGCRPFDFATLFRGDQAMPIKFPGLMDHTSDILGMTVPRSIAGRKLGNAASAGVHDVTGRSSRAIIARIRNAILVEVRIAVCDWAELQKPALRPRLKRDSAQDESAVGSLVQGLEQII